jgi:hypothetical protein
MEVARNTQAFPELLQTLAQDKQLDICIAAVKNSLAVPERSDKLSHALISAFCRRGSRGSNPSSFRRFLFSLPQCPASILAKNFRSISWLERFAIAGNPSTPESVLERMTLEGNQLVRRAAASNLAERRNKTSTMTSETPGS